MTRLIQMLLLLTLPFSTLGAGEVTTDIEYGEADGVSLKLDVRVPQGEGPFPIVILVHGGGWGSGDKAQDFEALTGPLTEAGIAWFSINYRLSPEHPWPACFEDMQTALRWVRTHAGEFHGDPGRIALVGYSAGGQISTMAAIRSEVGQSVQAVVGLAPAVDLVADSKRRGVVSPALRNLLGMSGELDEAALKKIAAISPAEEIKPGLPPFLLVQGTADQSVRHVDTLAFAARLEQVDVSCELIELNGAPHRIAEWGRFDPEYAKKVVSWLVARLGKDGDGGVP